MDYFVGQFRRQSESGALERTLDLGIQDSLELVYLPPRLLMGLLLKSMVFKFENFDNSFGKVLNAFELKLIDSASKQENSSMLIDLKWLLRELLGCTIS